METPLDRFDRAIASTRQVVAGVKPDQLATSSPCTEWDVAQLINHLIGANDFFIGMLGGAANGETDYAAGDFLTSFDERTAVTRALFAEPGALEREVQLPWGPGPAIAALGMACTDTFQHGWDLAKATGQSTDLDAELAADLHEGAKQSINPGFRGADGSGMPFGLEQQAPAGASAADQLAAFLGRVV